MKFLHTVHLLMFLCLVPSQAAERVALVIGNNAYQHGAPLKNCVNDARAVAAGLRDCGFAVTLVEDGSLQELEGKVRDFKREATGAKAAWFFYAGHGAEVDGRNYLIPVDAKVEEEFEVKHKTLALDQVLGAMDGSGAPLKVVVLDCCRDNPFGRGWSRSGAAGLAQVGATPQGTIIAYATSPGKVAADGNGENSPYTTALVSALAKPGLEIDAVFRETGRAVQEATAHKQSPWLNISFYGSFVVRLDNGGSGAVPTPESAVTIPGHEPTTAIPEVMRSHSSYALGFRTGQEFADTWGKYGVTAGDLDNVIFLYGFTAAIKGRTPEVEESRLQAAMEALGQTLQDREKSRTSANPGSGKGALEKLDPVVKADSSYALGFRTGGEFIEKFGGFGFIAEDLEKDVFLSAFMTALNGNMPEHEESKLQAAMEALNEMLQHREKALALVNLEAGRKFLAENARNRGVTTTASGLQYQVLRKGGQQKYVAPGKGEREKQFLVNYKGQLMDGTEFDASPPGEPVALTLHVIDGFKEALVMMPVGSKWKLFIPADLAYGVERRSVLISPNSVLVFELELIAIEDDPASPEGE